mmetsp:Transcript_10024/g.37983  ORF Transcript_10024/g.37983 Transcript_10024/m.37983 type:complete len:119 (+) Transcript_10024:1522-1878(+)
MAEFDRRTTTIDKIDEGNEATTRSTRSIRAGRILGAILVVGSIASMLLYTFWIIVLPLTRFKDLSTAELLARNFLGILIPASILTTGICSLGIFICYTLFVAAATSTAPREDCIQAKP